MNQEAQQLLTDIAQSPKTAAYISAATVGTGVGAWVEWVYSHIAFIPACIGAVLSTILIYTAIRKEIRDSRKHKMECKKVELEIQALKRDRTADQQP